MNAIESRGLTATAWPRTPDGRDDTFNTESDEGDDGCNLTTTVE